MKNKSERETRERYETRESTKKIRELRILRAFRVRSLANSPGRFYLFTWAFPLLLIPLLTPALPGWQKNSRIRRVAPERKIQTVVGYGPTQDTYGAGFAGDGGPVEKAKIFSATDIKFDSVSNRFRSSLPEQTVER
jgi:hypothetical protein